MKCANRMCEKEFEPTHWRQKYCCDRCREHVGAAKKLAKPGAKEKSLAAVEAWGKANPEKTKKSDRKRTAKRYSAGKLPPWMYS